MLRVLGGALVLLARGSFGITAGVRCARAARHLQAFCPAPSELLRCEIDYSLQPLPEVCALVAEAGSRGRPPRTSAALPRGCRGPVEPGPGRAAASPGGRAGPAELPQDAVMAVLELCSALGAATISTGRIVCWT